MIDRRLTDEELATLVDNCFPFNTGGAVIVNKDVLKAICDELIQKRETQEKLIELLEKVDEYSDKLEWKLLMNDLPKITKKVIKRRVEDGEVKNG